MQSVYSTATADEAAQNKNFKKSKKRYMYLDFACEVKNNLKSDGDTNYNQWAR